MIRSEQIIANRLPLLSAMVRAVLLTGLSWNIKVKKVKCLVLQMVASSLTMVSLSGMIRQRNISGS